MINRLGRIYFFGGLIVITISAIYLSIIVQMIKTSKHVEPTLLVMGIIGVCVGVMSVLLALDVFFVREKKPSIPVTNLEDQRGKIGSRKELFMLMGRLAILSALCAIAITALLPIMYDESSLEMVGIQYSGLILVIVFMFTLILEVSPRYLISTRSLG